MSLYTYLFYTQTSIAQERQSLERMLRFEAELAQAQAACGIIPQQAADIIQACCRIEFLDIEKLKLEIRLGGNAAIPLVQQLTRIVKNNDVEASRYVHVGATSQDVIDTATMLEIQEWMQWFDAKLNELAHVLFELTKQYRSTIMMGRTLLQQAKPMTFGLKTATWLEAVLRSKRRMKGMEILGLQLQGAVGSGNSAIQKEVQQKMAQSLGLPLAHSWHSNRDNFAEWASFLGILSGSLGKMAKDISLLMQTELGEVMEGAADGKGGSSTMPHKRNPVTCAAILANATRTPALVSTLLSAMPQEQERSAGLWHAEWETLTTLVELSAGSMDKTIDLMKGLEVNEERMLANVGMTHGLIFAENVSLALTPSYGKLQAHELVEKACKQSIKQGKSLQEVLATMDLPIADLDRLFVPKNSIGNSLSTIDEILQSYENTL